MNINSILNNRASLIVVALFLLVIAHSYSLFFFPPTEGWWQTYGYLYNQDLHLYSDINTAYTPLFIIFNAYLLKISDLYIVYRGIGLLLVLMTFIFLFLSLEKMKYSLVTAMVSAFIAVLLSMLNIVYIVFDYPILLNLLIVISFYFFIISIQMKQDNIQYLVVTTLVGLFTILTFYTKQNVGLLLGAGFFASYVYVLFQRNLLSSRLRLVIYLTSITTFFLIIMNMTNMDFDTFKLLTIQNDSKGSPMTVLMRIFEEDNLKIFGQSILFLLFISAVEKYKLLSFVAKKFRVSEYWIAWIVFIFVLLMLISRPEKYIILLSVTYVFYLALRLFLKKNNEFLFFPLAVQILAITMTAGLCIAGVFIIAAFAIAFFLTFFENFLQKLSYQKALLSLMIILTLIVTYKKMETPYQWWGLSQSKISEAKYSLPFKEMSYIKVDKMTSIFFNDVKYYADQQKSGDMYFYPHIPIFYQLYHSKPISPNLVQWFDVISTKNLQMELKILKQKQPSLIVVLDPPWSAYIGHAALKQSDLVQPEILNYLDQSVLNGKYKLEKYQIFDNNIFGDNLGRFSNIDISLRISNPVVIGKTWNTLLNTGILVENDFIISSIRHSGIKISDIEDYKLAKNDVITLQVRLSSLNKLIKLFGTPDATEQNFYSYRIYTKIGDSNETH